jgi:hypothetical protein
MKKDPRRGIGNLAERKLAKEENLRLKNLLLKVRLGRDQIAEGRGNTKPKNTDLISEKTISVKDQGVELLHLLKDQIADPLQDQTPISIEKKAEKMLRERKVREIGNTEDQKALIEASTEKTTEKR